MNEFINTMDKYNERDVEDGLLDGTLTEFFDNRLVSVKNGTFAETNVTTVKLPLLQNLSTGMFLGSKLKTFCSLAYFGHNQAFDGAADVERVHLFSANGIHGAYSFQNATSLTTLILSNKRKIEPLSYNPITMSFVRTPIANGNGYVYVRKKLLDQYKSATNWVLIADQIRAIEDYPEIKAIVDADLAEMRGEVT